MEKIVDFYVCYGEYGFVIEPQSGYVDLEDFKARWGDEDDKYGTFSLLLQSKDEVEAELAKEEEVKELLTWTACVEI